jgi:hypothetical protein
MKKDSYFLFSISVPLFFLFLVSFRTLPLSERIINAFLYTNVILIEAALLNKLLLESLIFYFLALMIFSVIQGALMLLLLIGETDHVSLYRSVYSQLLFVWPYTSIITAVFYVYCKKNTNFSIRLPCLYLMALVPIIFIILLDWRI